MEEVFNEADVKMMSGGSDNHLILLDLKDKNISGKFVEDQLSNIGIVVNKNAIKNDPKPKFETSGVRLGTAAVTTRGFKEAECAKIAATIATLINFWSQGVDCSDKLYSELSKEIQEMCQKHPIYGE